MIELLLGFAFGFIFGTVAVIAFLMHQGYEIKIGKPKQDTFVLNNGDGGDR